MEDSKRKVKRSSDFVKTESLGRYRTQNNLNNDEIARRVGRGVQPGTVSYWICNNTVPRWVVQELKLRTWGGSRLSRKQPAVAAPFKHKAGGDLYVVYIGAAEREPFKAFCTALGINVKAVL